MNKVEVIQILRSAGSSATRGMVCRECGCRGQNIARFSDGTAGYACKWNGHRTFTFAPMGSAPHSHAFGG